MPDLGNVQININLTLSDIREIVYRTCCERCADKCWDSILDKSSESAPKSIIKQILGPLTKQPETKPVKKR